MKRRSPPAALRTNRDTPRLGPRELNGVGACRLSGVGSRGLSGVGSRGLIGVEAQVGRCPVRFDSAQRTVKFANENLMAVTRSVGTIEARPDRSLRPVRSLRCRLGKGDSHAQRVS